MKRLLALAWGLLLLTPRAQAQFGYTVSNNAVIITNYSGVSTSLTIPSMIGGLPVTAIGPEAFFQLQGVTNISIPDSVESIGGEAFAACANIAEITVPSGVTNVGGGAFGACAILTRISVDPSNSFYSDLNGVLFSADQSQLIQYPAGLTGTYNIPGTVTNIAASAFLDCAQGLTGVSIPNTVLMVGEQAFDGCGSLTSVNVPDSVTYMGDAAFRNCRDLGAIALPSGLASIGFQEFASCGLLQIQIPASVTSISNEAFQACPYLTNVFLPGGVTNIGERVFTLCQNLTAITVDASNAYYADLNGVLFNKNLTTLLEYPGGLQDTYILPVTVTNIDNFAFSWSQVTNVILPDGLGNIGADAFYSCPGLTTVMIPASVTNIEDEAFNACPNLSVIIFKGNAPALGASVFTANTNATIYFQPDASGWSSTFGGLPTVKLTQTNQTGSLQVKILPASASVVGATWSVDGGPAQSSGEVVTNLAQGSHEVEFTPIAGWITPSNENVSVGAGTTVITGMYQAEKTTGNLLISITPPVAVGAGARWQIDGGPPQENGVEVTNISSGKHTVDFTSVAGWKSPASLSVEVHSKATTHGAGAYKSSETGIYTGLFLPEGGITEANSGMVRSLNVNSAGAYSGRLVLVGGNYLLAGKFDEFGAASNRIPRAVQQGGPIQLEMQWHWSNSPPQVTGTVTAASGEAALIADLSASSGEAAEYTVILPPTGLNAGFGYLLMTNHNGALAVSGVLPDGTPFNQNIPLDSNGDAPIYGSLYANTGLIEGWINLAGVAPQGNLTWIKPASHAARYPAGVTNVITLQGSRWNMPVHGTPAIDLPSGQLEISGGALLAPLDFDVALSSGDTLTKLGGATNSLAGSVNPKTGLLTVTFGNGVKKSTAVAKGVVLQNATNAAGLFLGPTNSGGFILTP